MFRAIPVALIVLTIAVPLSKGPAQPAGNSIRTLSAFSDVSMKGELGSRLNSAMANLLTRQDRYTLDTYRSNASSTPGALWPDWPGDQLGRMFSVMHVAEGYGWTQPGPLRKAVGDAVLKFQTKAGHFGSDTSDPKDVRIISGNAFALRGLLDAYEDTHDPRYLGSARKLARYYEASYDTWKGSENGMLHEFYGHCLDGLVRLYELGGDRWALELAEKAAARTGRTHHIHHSLSMYRGVIDLYRVTADRSFLDHVEDYLRWCRENRIVTGGLPEGMPRSEEDEGCALADYVVVNLMMFQATGLDSYIDDAERTLVNHFFMNQFHTGGFGHRAFASDVIGGKEWQGWGGQFGSENPGCCSMWGAWALGETGGYIVTRKDGDIEVNLYPSAVIEIPDLRARLDIESDFPRMSRVSLTIHCDGPIGRAIRLRIPAWAIGAAVKLNGIDQSITPENGRIVLARRWSSGDRIEIAFASSLRLVPWPDKGSDSMAVFDGPLCLGLSSAETDVNAFSRVLVSPGGKLLLTPEGRPQATDGKGGITSGFRPIAEEWLSPELKNPHRLRVLFIKHTE